MPKNRIRIVNLEGKCLKCKSTFATTMPKENFIEGTGMITFCKKCDKKIDYNVASYDEQFLEELIGQPCKICNYPISDIHHIIPKKFGGTDEIKNLVNLCPNHHRVFHLLVSMERKQRKLKNKYSNNFKLNQQARIVLEIMQNDRKMFDYFLSVKPILEDNSVFMTDAELFRHVKKLLKKNKEL